MDGEPSIMDKLMRLSAWLLAVAALATFSVVCGHAQEITVAESGTKVVAEVPVLTDAQKAEFFKRLFSIRNAQLQASLKREQGLQATLEAQQLDATASSLFAQYSEWAASLAGDTGCSLKTDATWDCPKPLQ